MRWTIASTGTIDASRVAVTRVLAPGFAVVRSDGEIRRRYEHCPVHPHAVQNSHPSRLIIAANDAPVKADYVLDRIEDAIAKLATFPNRGSHPRELLALGVRDYRQTFFTPYRLICRVMGKRVYVYLIADGREA